MNSLIMVFAVCLLLTGLCTSEAGTIGTTTTTTTRTTIGQLGFELGQKIGTIVKSQLDSEQIAQFENAANTLATVEFESAVAAATAATAAVLNSAKKTVAAATAAAKKNNNVAEIAQSLVAIGQSLASYESFSTNASEIAQQIGPKTQIIRQKFGAVAMAFAPLVASQFIAPLVNFYQTSQFKTIVDSYQIVDSYLAPRWPRTWTQRQRQQFISIMDSSLPKIVGQFVESFGNDIVAFQKEDDQTLVETLGQTFERLVDFDNNFVAGLGHH